MDVVETMEKKDKAIATILKLDMDTMEQVIRRDQKIMLLQRQITEKDNLIAHQYSLIMKQYEVIKTLCQQMGVEPPKIPV